MGRDKPLKGENTKLKKDIETAQAATQRLQAELHDKQTEVDRIIALREELATTKNDRERLQEALRSRDEDLVFLRGHLSQLTRPSTSSRYRHPRKRSGEKDGGSFGNDRPISVSA